MNFFVAVNEKEIKEDESFSSNKLQLLKQKKIKIKFNAAAYNFHSRSHALLRAL
jgi:hypothetical protein